jgi:hypothetical protein
MDIARNCRKLETVCISEMSSHVLDDNLIESFVVNCPNLNSFSFSTQVGKITSKSIDFFADNCKQLVKLRMNIYDPTTSKPVIFPESICKLKKECTNLRILYYAGGYDKDYLPRDVNNLTNIVSINKNEQIVKYKLKD